MDKNFRVRVLVGLGLFVVALIALYTFDSIPFKIIYGLFALVALIELFSFLKKKKSSLAVFLLLVEFLLIVGSVIFVARTGLYYFWYIILGVPGYDIFAYFFGKLLGVKIIKNSRPFPYISKNKTWEGTFFGLIFAISMVSILMATRGAFSTDWMYLLCGPLALIGDLLKRRFGIKDSNEILIKNKLFSKLELIIGGSEGHGGFLDRIDSTAFTTTVLLIISFMV